MRKRLNWKDYILFIIIISLILLLFFTFPPVFELFELKEWIKSVIIGSIISIISSLIVSLIFTIQMEKQDYIDELQREINNIFASNLRTQSEIFRTIYDITMLPKIKIAILHLLLSIKLNSYFLKLEYPDFIILYNKKIAEIEKIIDELTDDNNKKLIDDFNIALPIIIKHYAEISNELLKVQDLFCQKYKGIPKNEIKSEPIFNEFSDGNEPKD